MGEEAKEAPETLMAKARGLLKSAGIRVALLVALAAAVGLGVWLWVGPEELPDGIVSSNGRIEADEVDISAKYAGRVREILAKEGDLVQPGQVLAKMDTAELQARLEKANAEASRFESEVNESEATIAQREAELRLAKQELDRTLTLVKKGHVSVRVGDERQSKHDTATAALTAARAQLVTARRAVEAAEAEVRRIQTDLDDAVLTSPVMGRVLYRLAEPGEVLAAGGKVLTLINLQEVYMEVFLPSRDAGRISLGSEARIVLDPVPHFAIPANVSFVSPQAQFTPKQVETASEREKLMFRVKVKVPSELVKKHVERVKTGVRGTAFLRLTGMPGTEPTPWPEFLQRMPPGEPG